MNAKETDQTHGGDMVDTHEVDTRGGQGLEARPSALKADTRRTNGGHKADKVWRRGQSGIKADTRRTMADTLRTSSGDATRAYRGQPFFF